MSINLNQVALVILMNTMIMKREEIVKSISAFFSRFYGVIAFLKILQQATSFRDDTRVHK